MYILCSFLSAFPFPKLLFVPFLSYANSYIRKNWKRRFFVLQDTMLKYFKHAPKGGDTAGMENALSISLFLSFFLSFSLSLSLPLSLSLYVLLFLSFLFFLVRFAPLLCYYCSFSLSSCMQISLVLLFPLYFPLVLTYKTPFMSSHSWIYEHRRSHGWYFNDLSLPSSLYIYCVKSFFLPSFLSFLPLPVYKHIPPFSFVSIFSVAHL